MSSFTRISKKGTCRKCPIKNRFCVLLFSTKKQPLPTIRICISDNIVGNCSNSKILAVFRVFEGFLESGTWRIFSFLENAFAHFIFMPTTFPCYWVTKFENIVFFYSPYVAPSLPLPYLKMHLPIVCPLQLNQWERKHTNSEKWKCSGDKKNYSGWREKSFGAKDKYLETL